MPKDKIRPITEADRLLDYEKRSSRAVGIKTPKQRRTSRRAGRLHVVVVEAAGEPSRVFLQEARDQSVSLVETMVADLRLALAEVEAILALPPRRR